MSENGRLCRGDRAQGRGRKPWASGKPGQFPDSRCIPTSSPSELPRIAVSGRILGHDEIDATIQATSTSKVRRVYFGGCGPSQPGKGRSQSLEWPSAEEPQIAPHATVASPRISNLRDCVHDSGGPKGTRIVVGDALTFEVRGFAVRPLAGAARDRQAAGRAETVPSARPRTSTRGSIRRSIRRTAQESPAPPPPGPGRRGRAGIGDRAT